VQVVTKDGQTLTTKGQGAADKDSDLDPKTGKTDVIKLEANENIPNVDAGIVPAKEYKVDYEFQPSKAEGTPEKLPEEVLKQLPEAKEKLKDGSEVPSPKEFTPVKDEVNKGTWTFEAWDKETAKIDGKDEHVKGTWKFTPDPAKETGNVYVKYVTEDGEVLEAESIVKKDAEVGEAYTTEQKTFDGYEFVKLEDGSAPKDGKVEKGDQHVTYVYKKVKTPDPAKETGNVYVKYVDDKGNVLEEQSVVKKDAPVGEDYTTEQKKFDGYTFKEMDKTSAPKEGKVTKEDQTVIYVYTKDTTPPTTEVVTKYVDENGNPLALEEKGKQNKKDIPAYEYVKTYKDKDGNTVHVYRLKQNPTPSVDTRYVDENGNQLLPPKEGTKDPVTIGGYNFIITSKDKNGNTIHTYSKKPTEGVETRFVDTHGNQILADKTGTHDSSLINGYEFVRTEKDEQGNTTHIYRKLPTPSKEVVTKFIDENGLELSNPLTGRNPSKAIPGYEIVRTETDSNGNIIYVYRKKASESEKITKFVDENGKEISKSTKGDNPKKDIDGYEFVRTEKDEQGNTKHIYKKKVTPPAEEKGNVYVKYVTEDGEVLEAESIVKK
ncbi:MAG: MucBP domain-containing protein, partial [Finegoldia magna]|nr:MucBP domain-containing protein [Finegoldia magna]